MASLLTVPRSTDGKQKIGQMGEPQEELCVNGKPHISWMDPSNGEVVCPRPGCGLVKNGENFSRDIGNEVATHRIAPLTLFGGGLGRSLVETAEEFFGSQLGDQRRLYAAAARKQKSELSPWRQRILRSNATKIAPATLEDLGKHEEFRIASSLQALWDLINDTITHKLEKENGYNSEKEQWQWRSQETFKHARYLAAKNFIEYMKAADPQFPKHKDRIAVVVEWANQKVKGRL